MSIKEREPEIAALKAANLKLQNQVELMQTIINGLSEGVVATNLKGEFLVSNTTAKEIAGMPPDKDVPEESCEDCETFYPDKTTPVPATELPLYKAMQGEITDDVRLVLRNKSRPEGVFVSVSGRPLYDKTGDVMGGVITIRDVTQLESVTEQLEATVNELQTYNVLMDTIFSSISDGIVVADKDGKYVMFNETAKKMADYNIKDVHITQASDKFGLFRPDGHTIFPIDELPLVRALKGEQVDNVEILLRNSEVPDGINTRVSGRPMYDRNGAVVGGVAAIHDISDIKAAEAQLKVMNDELIVQSQLLQSIFNSIMDGVVVIDETGCVIMFNPSVQKLAGEGMLLQNINQWLKKYTCFYPDRVTPLPTEENPIIRTIQGESVNDVEMFVQNLKGLDNGLYVSVTGRPLRDVDGVQKGVVIVVRDLTNKINSEEALAQAFTRGRLEIVDTILHNVGNAINSVSVGIDTIHHQLVNDKLTPRLAALANAIEQHQDDLSDYVKNDPQGQKVLPFLLMLVHDFTDVRQQWKETVRRIRDRTAHIVDIIRTQNSYQGTSGTRKDINLAVAISDAVKILQDSIDKRQIQIEINCDSVHQEVRMQESQFHQMLVNLIKNSIEAIDELVKLGGLHEAPRIQILSQTEDGFLSIYVTDNGIGLTPEETKKIFAAGFTTKEHGSGLGLHSSANFVTSSGGRIYPLSPGKGKGTTMHVIFPIPTIQPGNHQELTQE